MSSRDRLSSATFTSDGRFLSSRTSFPQGSRSSLPDETCYSTRSSLPDDYQSEEEDVFDIPPKHPSMESLEKWKKATLTLNPARRFRYTVHAADVMPEIERVQSARVQKFRTSAHALRAAQRFKLAGAAFKRRAGGGLPPVGFDVAPDRLQRLIQERNIGSLEELGGVVGLANLLRTDPDKGINGDSEDLQERKNAYGTNTYPRKSPKNLFAFLWDACKDPTLVILMVCAALSLAFGIKSHGIKEGWYDGASIAFAVILVIFVTAVSDFKQSLQFRSLNEEKRNIQLQVVRGGRRFQLSIFEIVVGDIIPLKIGDQIPADGIFVSGHSLAIDESSMTGESDIVHIDRKHPFLLSGCKVADGYGLMIVTGVGMHTEWGQLMAVIGEELGEETPLQVRLNGIATFIGQIGLTVAVLVFVILIIFYFTGHASGSAAKFRAGHTDADDAVDHVVDIFAIAVTIIVVAVPEGLPLAVTLTLAYSMRKMMDDKALVRRLSACETMGSATTICSDKTGTLTLNQMTVVKAWVAGEMEEPVGNWRRLSSMVISLLHEGIGQNSTGSVFISKEGGEREVTGSPTEKAVLLWGLETGMVFEDVRSKSTILQAETFSSLKKRAGVAVRVADSEKVHIHWKGAAEIILCLCDKLLDATGSTLAMSEVKRLELLTEIEGMASASLRCLAFAFRELDTQEVPTIEEELESWRIPETQLTLMAIVGIKDPCRPGVREAVQLCINAGVRVRMVTGDNLITATAIASDCGILDQGGITIEGSMLRNYSQGDLDINAPNILVMARSSPSDKLLLVQTLKELGNVVAVTGDGTNDAPALHDADIGLAMGIQGTEVAKESADIIILDDNFASVVKVVRWGRSVYSNIQKFIQFQLTVNVAALVINFIAAVTSGDVPLTAVQLLWVNLIMDTLGALALATEPPSDELMLRPPIGRKEAIVTNVMLRNILGQAIYQLIVLLTLQFKGKKILKLTSPNANVVKNTIIFNAFVLCQIFNEINARKPTEFNIFKGLFRNRLFVGIITITTILQVIIVEFLNKFASTVKLSWQHWVICIAIGSLSWPIAFFVKLIPVPEKPILNRILRPRKHKRKHHPLEDVPDSERGEP